MLPADSRARPPYFPEQRHPLVTELAGYDDLELLAAFQQHPECGRYFVALFCRYSSLLYALAARAAADAVQVDYLFAMTWRHIFYELRGLDADLLVAAGARSLRSWLVEMVGFCAQQVALPSPENIHYDLAAASPPLWCHLEGALDGLSPLERAVLLLTQSAGWPLERVAEQVAISEPTPPSLESLEACLQSAQRRLERALPGDVREIYLVAA